MSFASSARPIVFSRFLGTDQRIGDCDDSHVLDSFNVEFRDGTMSRRGGRQRLLDTNTVRPTKIYYYNGATTTDVTLALTDGDFTTLGQTVVGSLYIGCPFQFAGVNVTVSSASTGVGAAVVSIFRRTSVDLGVLIPLTIVDTTAIAGNTMRQSGTISWSFGSIVGSNWDTGFVLPSFPSTLSLDQELYWVAVVPATTANVAEISLTLAATDGSLRSELGGMAEFVTRSGDRQIVAVSDFPGKFNDVTFAAAAVQIAGTGGGNIRASEARVWKYDLARGDCVPIRLPQSIRYNTYPGIRSSFVVFNGFLIGTTSGGYLWKYDGSLEASALEALPGLDLQNGVIGANSYLPQTPRGSFLDVYHSKLVVSGDTASPLSFYLSMEDNNLEQIPPNATVGGPNVWPLRYTYKIPGRDGDRITGASVINDRYVILTRSQAWVFDESSLKLANGDIGCVAPGSVQRIDNLLMFLSEQGVFTFDSVNAQNISERIAPFLRDRVNWASIVSASSAHYKAKSEYWLWLPIHGEWQTQVAVIYNYTTKEWRIAGGWYPWDTDARRDANSIQWSISAATQTLGSSGRQRLLTADTNGALWEEDVGTDDNGFVFPAYAMFRPMGAENYTTFRDWYLGTDMDGQWYEGFALGDGERLEQELDRRQVLVATNSEVAQKQARATSSVASEPQSLMDGTASWPVALNYAKPKKLKLSFARSLTKMQPVLHWAQGQYVSGVGVTNQVPARGRVYEVQIEISGKPSGR